MRKLQKGRSHPKANMVTVQDHDIILPLQLAFCFHKPEQNKVIKREPRKNVF